MLWVLSTANTVTDAWPPNIQFLVHLQMKNEELNVYISYIFRASNCPELHLHLQSLALKWSLPLMHLQDTELMASVRMQPQDRE